MDKNNKNKNLYKLITAIAILIVIVVVILIVIPKNTVDRSNEVIKGVEFIKMCEMEDAASIENEIYNNSKEGIISNMIQNLEDDPDYVWTALSQINTVYLGDSRIKALESYEFVDESRCFGIDMATIDYIPDFYQQLMVINPKLIVILYGLNDVGSPWMTPDEWAESLMQYIDEIHSFLPDCKIYILSNILPRIALDDRWYGMYDLTREWNARELEIFAENGYDFIDIGNLVEENAYYFLDDGVHMEAPFYPLLARKILMTYVEDGLEE